ncbi:hypothetical protein HMPREF1982_04407 [Clostridiales bacterium oral taxon 876 str. F0540]|nr:hypothetical protein HMPREF1982_04407 [Clostridiales bacterium oral taxon 876 str. F0540]
MRRTDITNGSVIFNNIRSRGGEFLCIGQEFAAIAITISLTLFLMVFPSGWSAQNVTVLRKYLNLTAG